MEEVVAFKFAQDPPVPSPDEDIPMAGTPVETPAAGIVRSNTSDVDVEMLEEDAAIKETATPIFANYDGANDDNVAQKKARKAPSRATVRPAKRPKTDAWSVENLMQNPKSKLLKVNIKVSLAWRLNLE